MKNQSRPWLGGLALAASFCAHAQPSSDVPSQAKGTLAFRSAFADYQRFRPVDAGDWKALNAALASDAAPPHDMAMPAAAPAPASAPTATRPRHAGHAMHGAMR